MEDLGILIHRIQIKRYSHLSFHFYPFLNNIFIDSTPDKKIQEFMGLQMCS